MIELLEFQRTAAESIADRFTPTTGQTPSSAAAATTRGRCPSSNHRRGGAPRGHAGVRADTG
jgi:hypothetical protein